MRALELRGGSRTLAGHRALLALLLAVVASGCNREPRGEPNARIRTTIGAAEAPVLQLPGGDTLHLSQDVAEFYRGREFRQAWTDYDEVLPRGLSLLETMGRSEEDGLDPETYRYSLAARMLQQVEEDSIREADEPAQMGLVDMVLSEVFARYAYHLAGGTVDPTAGGLDWRIERELPPIAALLDGIAQGTDPAELVSTLRPEAPQYERLMQALARYRQIQQRGGWPALPSDAAAERGSRAPVVQLLRQRLLVEADPREARLAQIGAADAALYDDSLHAALQRFQSRHGLEANGRLNEATLKELNTPVEERLLQLQLNMDRWRWLPRNLGDLYVLVNVAGFELEVVENDSAVLGMNVVVGQDAWRTPIFRDTMEHIVVNPYWNVPSGIEREEIIPAVQRDPGYLERQNMEVLHGDRVISPASIDWSAFQSGSSPYRFRQRPGGKNALGEVKFLFPNKDDIYLHDTPADHLFSESSRAFSHGCIRVEKPEELAKLLFDRATDRAPEDFDTLRQRSGEQWVSLNRPVPVYVLYFTAWAGADGTVRFHQDIYNIDRDMEEEARHKLQA